MGHSKPHMGAEPQTLSGLIGGVEFAQRGPPGPQKSFCFKAQMGLNPKLTLNSHRVYIARHLL